MVYDADEKGKELRMADALKKWEYAPGPDGSSPGPIGIVIPYRTLVDGGCHGGNPPFFIVDITAVKPTVNELSALALGHPSSSLGLAVFKSQPQVLS
eukprot:CAMPEP_0114517390 /NCGR_PEP_ID=MMETSP0109-20121206/17865_1 /TAXON_ID=29199 /ORGANISM="Chlorarachnion reptans, Strain CCCM449" /LENGTH=96 /DNA_ID=CAMNT_0001697901 /DNA_START=715 /DNA_END=1006 /DNA_ORIENTATION=-